MSAPTCCPVVELRQYTLKPGQREVLIDLFEREFVESQEATGLTLIGQFRDLDRPDYFVWLRGFADMAARARALEQFYGGPVWKANREAANATMIDSDNVLLLRPASAHSGFSLAGMRRPPLESAHKPNALLLATIHHLGETTGADFAGFFAREIKPELEKMGVSVRASFVTEDHPNTFPALPVREDANVFIWFTFFSDRAAYERHAIAFAHSNAGEKIAQKLSTNSQAKPEVLLLLPTARSFLGG